MRKNKDVLPFQAVVSLPLLSRGAYYHHLMDEDLWAEIFKRLLIDNLCRLRSVCKCWNSIISSAFFINLHLSFTPPCNFRRYIHVRDMRYHVRLNHYDDLTHGCYTLCTPLDVITGQHSIQQLYFPFRADRENGIKVFTCVDVIHGVVCISYSWSPSYSHLSPSFNSTFLWNPAIHKYVALPCLKLPRRLNAIGFGYDTSRKDFKVVLICTIPSGTYQVYSDRRGSWKTATDDGIKLESPWVFAPRQRSIFVNGTIHWILSSSKTCDDHNGSWYPKATGYSVLMFDCESEEFRRIDIPKKLFEWSLVACPQSVELSEHAGMLAAFVDMGYRICFDVWVMEEHGVSTSWKKLYTISRSNHFIVGDPSYEKLAPYGPNNPWYKFHGWDLRLHPSCSDHVYDLNMLLMDHPKAQSYAKQEIVTILTDDP